jgi:hypothetical protein
MPGQRHATRGPRPGEQSAAKCEALGTPVISRAVDHRRAIDIRSVGNGSDVSPGRTTSQGACPLPIELLAMRIAPVERYATAPRGIPRHETCVSRHPGSENRIQLSNWKPSLRKVTKATDFATRCGGLVHSAKPTRRPAGSSGPRRKSARRQIVPAQARRWRPEMAGRVGTCHATAMATGQDGLSSLAASW